LIRQNGLSNIFSPESDSRLSAGENQVAEVKVKELISGMSGQDSKINK